MSFGHQRGYFRTTNYKDGAFDHIISLSSGGEINDAILKIRVPHYPKDTPIIFTFTGLAYSVSAGTERDFSKVLFQGKEPISIVVDEEDGTATVGYPLIVSSGDVISVTEDSFSWPEFSDPPVTEVLMSSWPTSGSRTTYHENSDVHALWFDEFYNAPARMELSDTSYEWLPNGTAAAPSTLTFTAHFLKDGEKGKIKFRLEEISMLVGWCSNAGYAEQDRDLKILQDDNQGFIVTPDGSSYEAVTRDDEHSVEIVVRCFDYGAYGKLSAFCLKENGDKDETAIVRVINHPKNSANKPETPLPTRLFALIPYDEDDDNMADSWERGYASDTGKITDINEDLPEGYDEDFAFGSSSSQNLHLTRTGDGIAAFDEYRGFMVANKVGTVWTESHLRTSPINKDLFIYNQPLYDPNQDYDLARQSMLVVDQTVLRDLGYDFHYVRYGKFDSSTRLLCMNRKLPDLGSNQNIIWIDGEYTLLGGATPAAENTPPLPEASPWIPINNGHIIFYFKQLELDPNINGTRIQNLLHHEIGHSCDLRHHTAGQDEIKCVIVDCVHSNTSQEEFCGDCINKTKIKE